MGGDGATLQGWVNDRGIAGVNEGITKRLELSNLSDMPDCSPLSKMSRNIPLFFISGSIILSHGTEDRPAICECEHFVCVLKVQIRV